jgi:hypothetical protein
MRQVLSLTLSHITRTASTGMPFRTEVGPPARGGMDMARINIEECWWSDPRRDALRRALGSETQDQVAVQAWRLGQEYWARGKLIPWKTYRALVGADALIEVGLAEVRETEDPRSNPVQAESKQDPSRLQACFVYVRGSSEYHSWVQERRLKGSTGGKKSAQRPRDAKGRLLKKSKQTPSVSKPLALALALILVLTQTLQKKPLRRASKKTKKLARGRCCQRLQSNRKDRVQRQRSGGRIATPMKIAMGHLLRGVPRLEASSRPLLG